MATSGEILDTRQIKDGRAPLGKGIWVKIEKSETPVIRFFLNFAKGDGKEIRNKAVLVTGANRGIGRALVEKALEPASKKANRIRRNRGR